VFGEAVARAVRDRPEFEFVGIAGDGRHALQEIRRLRPEITVLDQQLPSLSGTEVLRAVSRDEIDTRVIILSGSGDGDLVYEALNLGAAGFLTKAATIGAICDAILAVARGGTVLAPEVQSGLAGALRTRGHHDQTVLSERESQVLSLIAEGLSAPAIAQRLMIGTSTVKTHVKNLFEKLEVSDRAAAVAEGMRRGLVE
jgi:two-component system nitrate/nitrite response regulator NarL